jgi:hypothetical protein
LPVDRLALKGLSPNNKEDQTCQWWKPIYKVKSCSFN